MGNNYSVTKDTTYIRAEEYAQTLPKLCYVQPNTTLDLNDILPQVFSANTIKINTGDTENKKEVCQGVESAAERLINRMTVGRDLETQRIRVKEQLKKLAANQTNELSADQKRIVEDIKTNNEQVSVSTRVFYNSVSKAGLDKYL